ncbi:GNAT family N-acetyltransferase [Flavobacterium sp. GT3R68]|uniref:GNAT family N-acetyltransferase n=1 Tax=Flavobacterium sp. GT3R68 TaxID=2594437 RepID=UPI000F895FA8|nr:GNAT family N-acetyltransferase [Flavobacterium sp. GT3R68]RTY88550.1 N-acetyltransferase [Flavobacterium sp. GSN2]TRW90583.1 GNAT family N-acetyltransferase [Flavobacterium sp. GT3R68]
MSYFTQESERLSFRKLTIDDIPVWTAFFINNNRIKFLGIDITKAPVVLATEWIQRQLERYETQGLGHLAVIEKQTGIFIGMGGILPREIEGKQEMEIAYSLQPEFWGKGYATEIANQLREFGFANGLSKRFISIIDKENGPSLHVASKNNMNIFYETHYLGMEVFVMGCEVA